MTVKVNRRTTVHKGRVFSLVGENVTLENGITVDVEFVEHPGATAIIPLLSETRIVMLKQYRHALKKHIWEIPAGTLDPQESELECAKRELGEEKVRDRAHEGGEQRDSNQQWTHRTAARKVLVRTLLPLTVVPS